MAADMYKTIRNYTACAKSRVKPRKSDAPSSNIPGNSAPRIPGYLYSRTVEEHQESHRFLLVMSDRFLKLTHVASLRRIDTYKYSVAFVEVWVFKYGPPKTLISDNGKQFAAKFFQAFHSLLGISKIFTSTYYLQTNGKIERYN